MYRLLSKHGTISAKKFTLADAREELKSDAIKAIVTSVKHKIVEYKLPQLTQTELLNEEANDLNKLQCLLTTRLESGDLETKRFTDELVLAEYLYKTYYNDLKDRGVL